MTYRENTQEKLCQVRFAYMYTGLRRVKAWLNPENFNLNRILLIYIIFGRTLITPF